MPKLSQAQVKQKADKYAALCKKIDKAEAAKNEELAPLMKKFDHAMQPILSHHEPIIARLQAKRESIETEILGWLEAHGKEITLAGEKAVAANANEEQNREVAPKTFFDFVKVKGDEFWNCLKVEIGKAEKFLGKSELSKIANRPKRLVASLTLKD